MVCTVGRRFGTDARVTYPGERAGGTGKGAMEAAFEEKMAKFGAAMERQGVHFTPLIIESTGKIHDDSLQWLRAIAQARPDPRDVGPALDDLMTKIAQTLQETNYLLVRGAVDGARAFH
eukprot:gene732-biopygen576